MTTEHAGSLDNNNNGERRKSFSQSSVNSSSSSSHEASNSDTMEGTLAEQKKGGIGLSESGIGLPTPSEKLEEEEQPDGGYGWLVVLGAFLVQVTSFGTATSVMQDYYEQNIFSDAPNSVLNLSFVGTLAVVCINAASPLVQICVSVFGLRVVLIAGTLFIALGLEMAGFSSQIWHLYLTQGILFGVGASCIYVAIMGVAPQWFTKRRGLALGIVASGSGIGGLIIPFIMTAINASLGPGWTYRILGFICLACDIVACIFIKERNPPAVRHRKKLSQIIDFSVLKDVNFLLFLVASDVGLFGYFIPYFFLPSNASSLGLSASQGSALVAVSAAANFVGRIVTGFLADCIGRINSNLLFTIITALSCLLIWTFAFTYGTLMAFSAVFGLTSGSYFTLLSPIIASLLGMERLSSGLPLLIFTNAISVFGPNIASAIQTGVDVQPFFTYKMFAGVAYLVSAVIIVILKLRLDRNVFAKV